MRMGSRACAEGVERVSKIVLPREGAGGAVEAVQRGVLEVPGSRKEVVGCNTVPVLEYALFTTGTTLGTGARVCTLYYRYDTGELEGR